MDYFLLNSKHQCWATFIYSCNIYADLHEGAPCIEWGFGALDQLKTVSSLLCPYGEKLTIIEEEKIGTEILPFRGNIAEIDDGGFRGTVIWFDDGGRDVRDSLSEVIDEVGFSTLTVEWFL